MMILQLVLSVLLLPVTLFAYSVYLLWQRQTQMKRTRGTPPGSLGLPFLGETVSLVMYGHQEFYCSRIAKYGGNFVTNILFNPQVVATNPQDAQFVLKSEAKGTSFNDWPATWQTMMGPNAVTVVTGEAHKKLRQVLGQPLLPEACRSYVESTDDCIVEFLQSAGLKPQLESTAFKALALEIFFRASFGSSISYEELEYLSDAYAVWSAGFFGLVPFDLPGTAYGRAMRAREDILRVLSDLLVRHKQTHPTETPTVFGRIMYAKGPDGSPLELAEILDNVLTMCFAGHDTTYATMSAMMAILFAPENELILNRLRSEVVSQFGSDIEMPLDYDELKSASFVNAVFDEVLRYVTIVGGAFRKALVELEMPSGSVVPEGWTMNYAMMAQHMAPAWGNSVNKFDPDRFLPLKEELKPYFVPFGGGSRVCLGEHLARLEMRIFIVRLMQGFDVKLIKAEKEFIPLNSYRCTFSLKERAA